ncbi:hypothetical protein [Paenibacillus alkalitolerans]|uniref:hypothetical protein n=1 Tax=Paenibacillus alkalitolerans TaxID=2799335 RepID=UPI0018F47E96|nr:hypothetical protein [Paenibacillus alkalitolerans]
MPRITISSVAKVGMSRFATAPVMVAADATNGMAVEAEYDGAILVVQNGAASPVTVKVLSNSKLPVDPDPAVQASAAWQLANLHRNYEVPAGQLAAIKLDDSANYRQDDGKFHLDFSSSASVTVGVIDTRIA